DRAGFVPGSPGSAPPPPQSGVVLPNWLWLAIAPVVVAIVVAVVIMMRHQTKRAPRTKQALQPPAVANTSLATPRYTPRQALIRSDLSANEGPSFTLHRPQAPHAPY